MRTEQAEQAEQAGRQRGFGGQTLQAQARRKALLGYAFLTPTLLGILLFTAGPMVASLGLSLFSWNIITPPEFVGLTNYGRLVADNQVFTSFVNTVQFVLMAVTLQVTLGMLLALGLAKPMHRVLRLYFRSAFLLPLLTSGAAISIVLSYLFNQHFGIINYYLGLLGVAPVPWLNSSRWALIAVTLAFVWHQLGFTFMLFLGGVASLPRDVLEAADVDGARGLRRLFGVTIPLLSPTILVATVVGVINALQVFEQPYVMTRGGPGNASRTVVLTIYEAAFRNLEIGFGSAIAVVLFVFIMIVTAVQFRLSRRWVFYQ